MSTWILPVLIFATWFAVLFAGITEKAVQDAKKKITHNPRSGVSILPAFPVAPLFFWGLAWAIDFVVAPWGTYSIGGLHCIFLIVSINTIFFDLCFLNRLENNKQT